MPALIDTGAGRTVLTPLAIEMLNLPLVDYITVSRAGGTDSRVPVYVASIQFPRYNLVNIDVVQVIGYDLPGGLFQCLIGRDILSHWLFTYNGKTGEWCIDGEDSTAWVEPPQGVHDVFISHASQDKAFVKPLVYALKSAGINVWYDEDMMSWGDSLRSFIDKGISNSRFGIVVLSKAFFERRRWTEHELNSLFAKERAGEKVILPIWHNVTQDDLAEYSPAFIDRIAMDSQKNSIEEIVQKLKLLLGPK